jgi:hypothetical protein
VNEGRTVTEGSVEELARNLHGGFAWRAEFDRLGQELMDELKQVDGVSEITVLQDNIVRILVTKDYDIRPRLARLATEHESLLLSGEREGTSLEELFLSLVREEPD